MLKRLNWYIRKGIRRGCIRRECLSSWATIVYWLARPSAYGELLWEQTDFYHSIKPSDSQWEIMCCICHRHCWLAETATGVPCLWSDETMLWTQSFFIFLFEWWVTLSLEWWSPPPPPPPHTHFLLLLCFCFCPSSDKVMLRLQMMQVLHHWSISHSRISIVHSTLHEQCMAVQATWLR